MPTKYTPLWTGEQLTFNPVLLEESVVEEIKVETRRKTYRRSFTLPSDPFKVCTVCETPKSKSEFRVDRRNLSGLQSACIVCQRLQHVQSHQRNPFGKLAHSCNSRAGRAGAKGTVTPEELNKLGREAGGLCFYCHRSYADYGAPHFDHYWPLSLSKQPEYENLATNYIANFRVACAPCNRAKGNLLPHIFMIWLEGLKGTSNVR